MQINIEILIGWDQAYREALQTVGQSWEGQMPSDKWKKKILLAEHSPIRATEYRIEYVDIQSWVVTHLVRHTAGIKHFVKTQRTDRTGINRDELPQGSLISYSLRLNAQSFINISRKRLCSCASRETRQTWEATIDELRKIDPILASVCVPDCLYRGSCYELKTCGKINNLQKELLDYRTT